MGLVDLLLQNAPALVGQVTKNPQVLNAALSLLSSAEGSVGGTGGLAGLVNAFQQKGLGDMMASWISTGPNPPVSASQLHDVLGADTIGQFAKQAGLSQAEAGPSLAALLPSLIDHLTPSGEMPPSGTLQSALGALMRGLGH